MKILRLADKLLEYSFYLIFLLVPLVFTNDTSELFEFNKMWLTFGLTIIVTGAWITKMIAQKRFYLKRTPLDIPIALFLLSQVISTFMSLDPHTSVWGYYSRFNGGLLSIVSYILLYYAFVSNLLTEKFIKKMLIVGLISGVIVALWGLPSHFGYDPTCYIFRGNFDVSCWTTDFQPKLRIFSTFGQPNWLAAYLDILIPISLAFAISNFTGKLNRKFIFYSAATFLFFLDLLFTKSQSGFLAIAVSLFVFIALPAYKQFKKTKNPDVLKGSHVKLIAAAILIAIVTTFFVGSPIDRLNGLTFPAIQQRLEKQKVVKKTTPIQSSIPALELNITDSGTIRSIVWKGAIDIWKHYPVFGSGVETFAFSYYRYRPVEHNLTSEWNYLYNKAHNEYLNFLATTGAFGFLTYMSIIFYFLYISFKSLYKRWSGLSVSEGARLQSVSEDRRGKIENDFLVLGLLTGYLSILVTNFFGFSVVMINIFFFLIPVFALNTQGLINDKFFSYGRQDSPKRLGARSLPVIGVFLVGAYLIVALFRFWSADKAYFMGMNLDRAQDFQTAYAYLYQSVSLRPSEPTFQDEFSVNNAVLAATLIGVNETKPSTESAQTKPVIDALLQSAIKTSDNVVAQHPNNVVFWKGRVRVFYTLAQVDPKYLPTALEAIRKAQALAPTDPTISYNMGILLGQSGDFDSAITTLEETIKLKPDYRDAHFGLALFYHQKAVDKNGHVIDSVTEDKAVAQMKYILDKIDPNDAQAQDALSAWGQ